MANSQLKPGEMEEQAKEVDEVSLEDEEILLAEEKVSEKSGTPTKVVEPEQSGSTTDNRPVVEEAAPVVDLTKDEEEEMDTGTPAISIEVYRARKDKEHVDSNVESTNDLTVSSGEGERDTSDQNDSQEEGADEASDSTVAGSEADGDQTLKPKKKKKKRRKDKGGKSWITTKKPDPLGKRRKHRRKSESSTSSEQETEETQAQKEAADREAMPPPAPVVDGKPSAVETGEVIKNDDEPEQVNMSVEMQTQLMEKNAAYEADRSNWSDAMADMKGQDDKTPEEELTEVMESFGPPPGPDDKTLESPLENLEKEVSQDVSGNQSEVSEKPADGFQETRSERKKRIKREKAKIESDEAERLREELVAAEKKRMEDDAAVLEAASEASKKASKSQKKKKRRRSKSGDESDVEERVPRSVERKSGREKYSPAHWKKHLLSGATHKHAGGRANPKEVLARFERDWYPAHPSVPRGSDGNLTVTAAKPPKEVKIVDYYLRRDCANFKIRCWGLNNFISEETRRGKAVRPLMPIPGNGEDEEWTADASEDEYEMEGVKKEDHFPRPEVIMDNEGHFLDMMDCVATDLEVDLEYSLRWEVADHFALSRIRWALDTYEDGQRCPFLYCRMEILNYNTGVRTYPTRERFLRHLTELHTPACRSYRCNIKGRSRSSSQCSVTTDRKCELLHHKSVRGLDSAVDADGFWYSHRHAISHKISMPIINEMEGLIIKNADYAMLSILPPKQMMEWKVWSGETTKGMKRSQSQELQTSSAKYQKGKGGHAKSSTSQSNLIDAPIPDKSAWLAKSQEQSKAAASSMPRIPKIIVPTLTPTNDSPPKDQVGDENANILPVGPPMGEDGTTIGDALHHVTEDLRNGCHNQLDQVRSYLVKHVDQTFEKMEIFCKDQLDHIVTSMEPAVGDARSLQKEVETLRNKLSEVTINHDYLVAECRSKDQEIENLKRKVFRLENRPHGSSSVPTPSVVSPVTQIPSATVSTAIPMEEDSVQGAVGGTPIPPTEPTEQLAAMNLLQDMLSKAGEDTIRSILGGICQSLAPAVVKKPDPST